MKTSILSALLLITTYICYGQMPMFDQSKIETSPEINSLYVVINDVVDSNLYIDLWDSWKNPSQSLILNSEKLSIVSSDRYYPNSDKLDLKDRNFIDLRDTIIKYTVEWDKKKKEEQLILSLFIKNSPNNNPLTYKSAIRRVLKKSNSTEYIIQDVSSDNGQYFALIGKLKKKNYKSYDNNIDKKEYSLALFDRRLNHCFFSIIQLDSVSITSKIVKTSVSNKGYVYIILRDDCNKKISKYSIHQISPKGKTKSAIINSNNDRISTPKISITDSSIEATFLYSNDSIDVDGYSGMKGIFSCFVHDNDLDFLEITRTPLEIDFLKASFSEVEKSIITKNISKKKTISEFDKYKLISSKQINGKSKLVILEKQFTSSHSNLHSTTILNSNSRNSVYHNDDILIIKLDSNQNIEWKQILNKKQITAKIWMHFTYNSFIHFIGDKHLYILFNSDISSLDWERSHGAKELTPYYSNSVGFIQLTKLNLHTGNIDRIQFSSSDYNLIPSWSKQFDQSCYLVSTKNKSRLGKYYILRFNTE